MAILDALPKDGELIFAGERKGKPLDHKALQRVLQRIGVDAVPRGFRSSFRDWGAELGNYPNDRAGAGARGRRHGRGRIPARRHAGEASRPDGGLATVLREQGG
jgi:hypothetical protein